MKRVTCLPVHAIRVRIGKAPIERAPNPDRKSALELALRSYAEQKEGVVVDPVVGTSFDSLEEAYEFYNLYSWETGFGVSFAKSIVCGCAVSTCAGLLYSFFCVF
jgi:hypothetical protein